MNIEIQNLIVYLILLVVCYLLFGSTLRWAIRKILAIRKTPPQEDSSSNQSGIESKAFVRKEDCNKCGK